MTSTETTSYAVTDAERPLWVGQTPAAWGDVVPSIDPEQAQDAASMMPPTSRCRSPWPTLQSTHRPRASTSRSN